MKGIRFYEEFKNKRKGIGKGTVVAAIVENGAYSEIDYIKDGITYYRACYEAICGVFDRPDSVVCSSSVSLEYLTLNCKRIPESKAREVHPRLFEYLDSED